MRRSAHFTNLRDPCTHQDPGVGDEHDLIIGVHQRGGDHLAVAPALLDGNHALGTASMAGVLINRRAFAVAVFGGCQHAGGL